MSLTIKALEKIGQNTSIKQHDSLQEMLANVDVKESLLNKLNTIDLICIQVDDDDDEINR